MHGKSSAVWGVLTTIGAFLIYLSSGYLYTIGNMNTYLVPSMPISPGQTVWIYAVSVSAESVCMPLGGFLESKIGFRPVVGVAALMSSGGIALSNLTVFAGLGPFIITYAIMFGIGTGLTYTVLFTLAADWFPKHRAAVTGIILSGIGMGASVFAPIQTALINPDNKLINDSSLRDNVPQSFLILSAIMFSLQVVGFCLLRKNRKPGESDFFLEDADTERSKAGSSDFELDSIVLPDYQIPTAANYTIKQALKSIDFYLITMMIFINTVPAALQSSSYKMFGQENGLDDQFLSIVTACASISNCFGRAIWGLMSDLLSFKIPLIWFLLQWALFLGTLPVIATSQTFQPLFAIWVILLFFTMSGNFVLMPGSCFRIFGPMNMATIYGLIHCTTCPSAFILAAITSIHDIKEDFDLVFYICCALCILSFILAIFLKDNASKLKKATSPCVRLSDFYRYVPPAVAANDFDTVDSTAEDDEDRL